MVRGKQSRRELSFPGCSSTRRGGVRGSGSCLHDAVLAEARKRGYGGIELFTAAANLRSRTFYDARGWRLLDADGYEHDGLWLVGYERLPGA